MSSIFVFKTLINIKYFRSKHNLLNATVVAFLTSARNKFTMKIENSKNLNGFEAWKWRTFMWYWWRFIWIDVFHIWNMKQAQWIPSIWWNGSLIACETRKWNFKTCLDRHVSDWYQLFSVNGISYRGENCLAFEYQCKRFGSFRMKMFRKVSYLN